MAIYRDRSRSMANRFAAAKSLIIMIFITIRGTG
jgi:hypothetical protein